MSTVPKERRISAAILGTESRKLPSPRLPTLVPDRCFSIYVAETAGFKIAPVPALVRAPQGHSAEREDLLAGAGKRAGGDHHSLSFRPASGSSPKFAKPQPRSPKSLRSFAEVA